MKPNITEIELGGAISQDILAEILPDHIVDRITEPGGRTGTGYVLEVDQENGIIRLSNPVWEN